MPVVVSTGRTRFGTHPTPRGDGKRAGSAIALQISRPTLSRKPSTGFQAAAGRPSAPRVSHPFQGKSFNFTVRMKIGESRPA
jgi:hypothetical protein